MTNVSTYTGSMISSAHRLFRMFGPGIVTGSADDDPSGIATYSQSGAQFGYALSWTMFLTTPFMIAIQMVTARIGAVTGRGLAANLGKAMPASDREFCRVDPGSRPPRATSRQFQPTTRICARARGHAGERDRDCEPISISRDAVRLNSRASNPSSAR